MKNENDKPSGSVLENIVLGVLLIGMLGVFLLVYPPEPREYLPR